jgi:general secretion pathway protein C
MRWLQFGAAWGQRVVAVGEQRWRRLVLLLALIWLLAVLARLLWLLLPAPQPAAEGPAPAGRAAAPAVGVDIDVLAGWHLFGQAGEPARQPDRGAVEIDAAADTTLNLTLQGVMSSADGELGRAVIFGQGGQQQFAIGEALPATGRVTLARVLPDRVIIDNNGRLETLWLYDPAAPAAPVQPLDRGRDRADQPAAGAASLTEVIQVAAVHDNGRLLGYRVSPGANSALFQQLGFEAGDVIVAIDGNDLTDPQQALALYNTIRSASQARFDVRRGDRELSVDVALPAP